MKSIRLLLASAASTLLSASPAHATVNLLLNGGFENSNTTTTYANGNNTSTTTPVVVPGWTLVAGNTNLQQGSATGNGFALPNLAPFNGAYSGGSQATTSTGLNNQTTDTGGNRFFDGTNDNAQGYTIITQGFTLAATTTVTGSYALGYRDTGANVAGTAANFTNNTISRVEILNSVGTAVYVSYGDLASPGGTLSANPGWEVNNINAGSLAAGNYTVRIDLVGTQNIDAVNLVPEPSTWALLCLGVAGMGAMVLRRRGA